MAGVIIEATVSAGDASLTDDLDAILHANGLVRIAMHHPGACRPCQDNKDPDNVPCAECRGNIAGLHAGHTRAEAVGNLCQCWVEIVEVDDKGRAVTDA